MWLDRLSDDEVVVLARAVGLDLPVEDVAAVGELLRVYERNFALIADLDLSGVDPSVGFDPRWA
jgi:hypothetical protein